MSQYPPSPPAYGALPQDPSQYSGYATPPPTYLVWGILTALLCIMPLGVASIVFAAQVNSKWAAGDVAGAQQSSAKAKNFAIWSAGAFIVLMVLVFVFTFVAALAGS
jgi:hypothetical protein